ncbi:MAG: Rne/Rng family ribonuclease [Candidatus Coatesbacteria bacterium]
MASQEVLIEIEPWEERVAIREAGVLSEFALERPGDVPRVGSVYRGRIVGLLTSVGAALVDIGEGDSAFLPLRNSETEEVQAAHRGDAVLVQVTKRPLGGKRAQVTRQISLAGRYVVLMPGGSPLKISRRIADEAERARLEAVLASLRPPDAGLVARTAALGRTAEMIAPDLKALQVEWERIAKLAIDAPVPSCLRVAPPLRVRALRDMCGPGVERIRLSGDDGGALLAFARDRYPDLAGAIERDPQGGLFWRTGLEAELEQLFERRVFLKSGGSLVFDFTEALTVVDVNSGRPFEEGSPEETALRTNLEAAQEIPRQLKLRGIGGIIVVDFIDMPNPEHQKQMMEVLEAALRHDRVKTQVAVLSPLGVVEMTRKRVDDTPYHHLTEMCPTCGGRGRTLAPATLVIQVARKVLRLIREGGREPVTVRVHPRLGVLLREDSHLLEASLHDQGRANIVIADDASLPYEQFRVTAAEG